MIELEGTWEEILAHAPELAGHKVRLTVLDVEANGAGEEMTPAQRFAAAIRELEERDKEMPLAPVADSVAIVREGRAGAMYGYDPAE
jgi:hypothetical protein